MYDTKCIFSAHIMCMMHTPFNEQFEKPIFGTPKEHFNLLILEALQEV